MYDDTIAVMRDAHLSGDTKWLSVVSRHLAETMGAEKCWWHGVSPAAAFALTDDALGPVMEFIWVPPGEFFMGASMIEGSQNYDPGAYDDEGPVRKVTISRGFWVGTFPVTAEQFCVVEGNSAVFKGFERHPVTKISFSDANDFCTTLQTRLRKHIVRLPTEAEWEYAARGTDGRKYPWGNDHPAKRHAVFDTGSTETVGTHPDGAGPFGHQDLAGNVWEWCQDAWGDRHLTEVVDPCRDDDNTDEAPRVVRGGSWLDPSWALRCSYRGWGHPGRRFGFVGFRVVVRPG